VTNSEKRTGARGRQPGRLGVVLLGIVATLLTALVGPAGAAPVGRFSGDRSATTDLQATTAAIHTRSSCNSRICLETRYDGYFGHNVRGMTAYLKYGQRGHFQFFGPAGHIANSDTRTWVAWEAFDYNRFMTGNSDALWCARFWVYNNGHWADWSGIVCTNSG
jgi:hypothetical protein